MDFSSQLIDGLRRAQSVAIFTGAGASAESGVPTFRDAQTGIWSQFRAEDLATPEAFLRDPITVWNWYAWRRTLIAAAAPNPAHRAIAAMAAHVPSLTVITQNVDGLHQRAGSAEVIELHGNIWRSQCFDCSAVADEMPGDEAVPRRCAHCGGMLRPGVVWFGEALPVQAWRRAAELAATCDVFLCIGTSSLVEPAASLPRHARAAGAQVVQINPEATAHDAIAHYVLRGKAAEILPALLRAAWPSV